MYVCMSVCHGQTSNWFFFFCFSTESIHFWPSSLHVVLYKTLLFDFWFRPHNAQNLLSKICNCTKSPISRLVWQIDRRRLGLLGGFRGWSIRWNHVQCCRADPRCHGNDIWPRHGDLIAYRLVHSPESLVLIVHFCEPACERDLSLHHHCILLQWRRHRYGHYGHGHSTFRSAMAINGFGHSTFY